MRTSNSIKNSISSIASSCISMIIGFVAQAIFIDILGPEYLGLNGLFNNIIFMLSIFELGIGNAIIYNLYKPIAENKTEEVKSLMLFYKKAYNLIAIIIFLFSLVLLPFLQYIVGEITININIYIVYALFIINTVSTYLISYKRSLIYANQQSYIINIIHICYLIIINLSQIIILYLTKNYYLYLIIKIICQILENIIITIYSNKLYPYILEKNIKKIEKNTEKKLFSKIKSLFFHRIGGIFIGGTDNIIISHYLGISIVGLYSNYNMIIGAINNLFIQIINSTTASVGNLLVENNSTKSYQVFKRIRFLNFWLACFSGICLLVIIQPFIKVWVGEEYLLSMLVVSTLVFNYFQKMMRGVYGTFKDSAGIWQEDKYVPLVESLLNIVFSILLLKIFGLAGVFMGTIISGLALWCYSYPKYVYKKLFNRSYLDYAKETLGYIFLFILLSLLTYEISNLIIVSNPYLQVIINTLIAITIPNTIILILFRKTDNFKYFKELVQKLLKKATKRT